MRGSTTSLALLAGLLAYAPSAEAGDDQSGYAEVNYWSRFIRRGFDLNDGRPVIQPVAGFELPLGFSIEGSGFFAQDRHALDELDGTFSYERELGALTMTASLLSYQYLTEHAAGEGIGYGNEQEILIGVSVKPSPVSWSLQYGRGLGGEAERDGIGNFVELSLSHESPLGSSTWTNEFSASWLDQYGVPGKVSELSALTEVAFDAGGVTVEPRAGLTWLPEPALTNGNDERLVFIGGIGILYTW